jgi:hypothetical protein
MRVFTLDDGHQPTMYCENAHDVANGIIDLLGDNGEYEDLSDDYRLIIGFIDISKEEYDALEIWEPL